MMFDISTETKKFRHWHAQLLNGYLEISPPYAPNDKRTDAFGRISCLTPRPWWSENLAEDGYIHANISRHLRFAGFGIELAALLLDARWTQLRKRVGGILALKTDFEMFEAEFKNDITQGFGLIFQAVQLAWGRMISGHRAFQFQVCTRLIGLRKENEVVEAYLKSIEMYTPRPYLLPTYSFSNMDNSLVAEIPVRGFCACAARSPCGSYIACGAGNDVVIVKTDSGEIIRRLKGHEGGVICVSFADKSNFVVSGSVDKTIREWDLVNDNVRVLRWHRDRVTGVVVNSVKGGQIISTSADGALRISDRATSVHVSIPQNNRVYCVAMCVEGEMIAFGLDDGTLKVVHNATREVLYSHYVPDALRKNSEQRSFSLSSVSFSPSGLHLIAGSFDHTIRIWNTRTWILGKSLKGHEGWVSSVSFSPDGKHIASSSYDGTVRVWGLESEKCVWASSKISSVITSALFSADGKMIISASRDGIVRFWDPSVRRKSRDIKFRHTGKILAIAISSNGLRAATASVDETVRISDTITGEQVGVPLRGHEFSPTCVSFSPDAKLLVSGSGDNYLRLWDTRTHYQIGGPFEGHDNTVSAVSFSSDGLRIISGSADGTVRTWNVKTHEQVGHTLSGDSSKFYCVAESSDGSHVVARYRCGVGAIWKRENGEMVWKSELRSSRFENRITDEEAETIIRNCGQHTPRLWPEAFAALTTELYCDGASVYSNLREENNLLADNLIRDTPFPSWDYHAGTKAFSAGLESGAVVICKLIVE